MINSDNINKDNDINHALSVPVADNAVDDNANTMRRDDSNDGILKVSKCCISSGIVFLTTYTYNMSFWYFYSC